MQESSIGSSPSGSFVQQAERQTWTLTSSRRSSRKNRQPQHQGHSSASNSALRKSAEGTLNGNGQSTFHFPDWGLPWEPFKITVAAFYALCAVAALDSTIGFFRSSNEQHPLDVRGFIVGVLEHPPGVFDGPAIDYTHLSVILVLMAYLMWLSLHFFYNLVYFLCIPVDQPWNRVFGFINLSVTLSLFYFLGSSLGPPSHVQLIFIFLIVLIDLHLPVWVLRDLPKDVLNAKQRHWWVGKSVVVQLPSVGYLISLQPSELSDVKWALIVLGVVILMAVLVPLEHLTDLRPSVGFTRAPRVRGRGDAP